MTYGQIAALCGHPYAARIIGGIAHHAPCANLPACSTGLHSADWRMVHGLYCPAHDLPWHRVVKKDGSLAEGYPGGTEGHKQVLQAEGVKIKGYRIENVERLIWQPKSHR